MLDIVLGGGVESSAATGDSERWEAAAHKALANYDFRHAELAARQALVARELIHGAESPELIWPLSLLIDALRSQMDVGLAREAVRFGERRLALQRTALVGSRLEWGLAIERALALCYSDGVTIDATWAEALRCELASASTGDA